MKLVLITLLLITSLFSQEYDLNNDFTQEQASVFQDEEKQDLNTNDEILNNEESKEAPFIMEEEVKPQNLYLSYLYYPEKIFKNQRFKITVKAIVTRNDIDKISTKFLNIKNIDILNDDSPWEETEAQIFENTYYFKAYEDNFTLPTFEVSLIKGGALFKNDLADNSSSNIVETQSIAAQDVLFSEIGKEVDNFSSVIANSLVINAHKTKQYNNEELITIFDISATESNLEDFYIKGVEEQNISKFTDEYPKQNLLYHLVLPVHTKKLEFSYYNNLQKKFVTIKVPLILENELVSTQTDLNPNKSNLLLYKKIALGTIFLIFLVIFIINRNKLYLILSLISLIVLLIYIFPNKKAILKKDSFIYILPTKKSTVFQKTSNNLSVEVSIQRGDFIKIIVNQDDKNIIGWVKKDDLIKN